MGGSISRRSWFTALVTGLLGLLGSQRVCFGKADATSPGQPAGPEREGTCSSASPYRTTYTYSIGASSQLGGEGQAQVTTIVYDQGLRDGKMTTIVYPLKKQAAPVAGTARPRLMELDMVD